MAELNLETGWFVKQITHPGKTAVTTDILVLISNIMDKLQETNIGKIGDCIEVYRKNEGIPTVEGLIIASKKP